MNAPPRSRAKSPAPPAGPFVPLQRLSRFFGDLHAGRRTSPSQERTALRLARSLGRAAVPLCVRKLASRNDAEARWAYHLLAHLAVAPNASPRVIAALRRLAATADADRAATRALALLADLGAEPPPGVTIRDPDAVHRRSLADLAASLTTPAEVARAADHLLSDLEPAELWELVSDLTTAEPPAAFALAGELLARDDLGEVLRREVRKLRAGLAVELAGARRRSPPIPRADVSVGRRRDGSAVVLARASTGPRHCRVLCAAVAPDGTIADVYYHDRLSAAMIARELERPFALRGYTLLPADVPAGAALLAAAARATHSRGAPLPRNYYLGRDLLGLRDDHLCAAARAPALDDAARLARATALLAAGDAERARPLFASHVEAVPDDPDGCAGMGLCLLALGDASAAHCHIDRAVRLDPDNALHLWNAAACAHRAGRRGGCYLALVAFLDATEDHDGSPAYRDAASQRALARRHVAEYERIARLEHPHVPPAVLARADDLCHRGACLIAEEHLCEAIAALSRAIALAPSHYEAWTQLGIARTRLGQSAAAEGCLAHALALRPAHPPAQAARAQLARRGPARARAANARRVAHERPEAG